jgi:hypothetical protein
MDFSTLASAPEAEDLAAICAFFHLFFACPPILGYPLLE